MGNNQHLKRTSMPSSWPVRKKNISFVVKPNPGSHKSKYVTPIVILLRDVLNYTSTSKEAKYVVNNQEVLINGKKVTDIKAPVGLFDVVEISSIKEKFVILFNEFGRLKLVPTKDDLIYLKVSGKKTTPGKKFQLNFMNGFNLIVDEKSFNGVKVNDTVVYDFAKKKVSSVLNLKEGNVVYVFDGKFKGTFGEVKTFVKYNGIARDLVHFEVEGQVHATAKDFCYVIGSKKEDLKRFA